MNVYDYTTDWQMYSRLDVSKMFIKDYISKNPQNRYALTIFAWDSVDILPLTNDILLFTNFLDKINSNFVVNQWTNIFDWLSSWLSRFSDDKFWWWVILVSDFEIPNITSSQKKSYIESFWEIKKFMKDRDIVLYNIWVWTIDWWKILKIRDNFWRSIYLRDSFWREVVSVLDIDFLKDFSWFFKSKYFHISNISRISNISSNISSIPKKQIDFDLDLKKDFSRYFIVISYFLFLLFMWLYYFLRQNKKRA